MKRSLRILIVLASTFAMVLVLNVGVAFAHPGGAEDAFTANSLDNSAPVGSNIGPAAATDHPGFVNGFQNSNSNAFNAIAGNPLCPLHHPQS